MRKTTDYSKYAILFVDDEPQSLKYMHKALQDDIEVLIADGVAAGKQLLTQHADKIAVVISDQRMPGASGVELLSHVRAHHANIVRILTTAYSDLDSAIDAVNSGAIFRYITKPWNIRELRGTVLRAVDFHIAQKERDLLLREKLSVLQRMLIIDRIRSFTVLSMGLANRLRNSVNALKVFLDHAPANSLDSVDGGSDLDWTDVWGLAQNESRRILDAVQQVVDQTCDQPHRFDEDASIADILKQAVDGDHPGIEVHLADGITPLRCEPSLLTRTFKILVQRIGSLTKPDTPVLIRVSPADDIWGAVGLAIRFEAPGEAWTNDQLRKLFIAAIPSGDDQSDFNIDLLLAYFITYHHGGDLLVHSGQADGAAPGVEVRLPYDPQTAGNARLDSDWLERMFVHCDGWGALGG